MFKKFSNGARKVLKKEIFPKHKQPSLEAGLLVILVVISVVSIGLHTGPEVTGMATAEVTGGMGKVTGMDVYSNFQAAEKPENIGKTVAIVNKEYDVTKYQNTYVFFEKGKLQGTDSSGSQQFTRASTTYGPLPATTTSTTGQNLPTPSKQQQTSLPEPQEAKYTTVSKENLNPEYLKKYKGESILGEDGCVYNINSDGTIIQKTKEKFDSSGQTTYTWEEYKHPYELTAKIPIIVEGKTEYAYITDTISAKNLDDAKKQFQESRKEELITSITEGPPPSEPTTELQLSTFEIDYIGDRNVVVEKKGDKVIRYYAPKVDEEQFVYDLQESLQQKEAARQEIINIKKENADNGIQLTDHQAAQILLKDSRVDQSIKNGIEALGYKPAEPKEGEEKAPEIEGLVEITRGGEGTGTYKYKGKILIKEEEIQAARKEWKTEKAIKEYKLTDSKYTDKSGLEIYQTKDGTYKTIDNNGNLQDYSGAFYKKETAFGPDNQIPISVYELEKGKPKYSYSYIEDLGEGLKFDKETLTKIKEKGGSVREIYDDTYGTRGVEILKDGEVVRTINIGGYDATTRMGTRTITDHEHIYLNSEGEKISKKEYEKLGEEGKNPKDVQITLIETEEFGKDDKGERSLTTYYHETLKIEDKNIIIEGIKTNVKSGEILGYTYRIHKRNEDGEYEEAAEIRLDKDGNAIDEEGNKREMENEEEKKILKEAQTKFSQFKSRQWFANFEFKLTQFKGLAGWSQLIFSDETLAEWREGVDKLFSSMYLGTDYWVSKICSKQIPKQNEGTFLMETKDGLFDIVAHVEGEKTAIPGPEQTQYLYKLTFSVRNPKYSQYDKLKFNVYLYGDKTVQLYPQYIEVKDGNSFTRGSGQRKDGQLIYDKEHGKPIVQYSPSNYNKICIKFENGITNAEGKREDEVCNSIVEYKGSATEYQKKVTTTATTGTQTAQGDQYQEADF